MITRAELTEIIREIYSCVRKSADMGKDNGDCNGFGNGGILDAGGAQ
jgi:hypothetical protein